MLQTASRKLIEFKFPALWHRLLSRRRSRVDFRASIWFTPLWLALCYHQDRTPWEYIRAKRFHWINALFTLGTMQWPKPAKFKLIEVWWNQGSDCVHFRRILGGNMKWSIENFFWNDDVWRRGSLPLRTGQAKRNEVEIGWTELKWVSYNSTTWFCSRLFQWFKMLNYFMKVSLTELSEYYPAVSEVNDWKTIFVLSYFSIQFICTDSIYFFDLLIANVSSYNTWANF